MVILFGFVQIVDPSSTYAYVVNSSMIVLTLVQRSFVDTLFNKNINQKIKGVMAGLYFFTGCVGALIYSQVGGYLYTNYGAQFPFIAVAIYDGFYAVLVLSLRACKVFMQ
mmetsp:Transcript_41273/g.30344  ORF Transcript_41273/g.30344 Transcript_41273/m.30344 type:complete len:110 (-) Transcript_41273:40-369(-)